MTAYIQCLWACDDFSGRLRRRGFWSFCLLNTVFFALFTLGDALVYGSAFELYQPFALGYALAMAIPYVAANVRRLHDTGRSGWWYLLHFVPGGALLLFYFLLQAGESGSNRYGPDPKAARTGDLGDCHPPSNTVWAA